MRILKLADVAQKIGQRKTWIYDMVQAGRFPAPIKLAGSERAGGWVESEIDEYIAAAVRERDGNREARRRPVFAKAAKQAQMAE
jgi:prophage regulatory protein